MSTVLVTGATGFVGSNLVKELVKNNYDVYCLVRKTSDKSLLSGLNIKYIYGSIEDKTSLIIAFKDIRNSFPEYVIHCAGLITTLKKEEYFKVNYEGTKNLIEACLSYKEKIKRFVYISSLAASGPGTGKNPRLEEDISDTPSFYGQSKLAGEKAVKELWKTNFTVVRPCVVYGPGDRGVYEYFRIISKGIMPIPGKGDLELTLVYVSDLVNAIILAMENDKANNETFFVSDGNVYKLKEILEEIKKAINKKTVTIHIPLSVISAFAFVSEILAVVFKSKEMFTRQKALEIKQKGWVCSTEKIQKLGFKPGYNLKTGVEETVKWYKEKGWL